MKQHFLPTYFDVKYLSKYIRNEYLLRRYEPITLTKLRDWFIKIQGF